MTRRAAFRGVVFASVLAFTTPVCSAQPTIKTIVGGGPSLIPSQGVLATTIGIANSNMGHALATDSAGNLYYASSNVLYRIDGSDMVTAVAGTGVSGFNDGGGVAPNASFGQIASLAVDGNFLYMADTGNLCVWQVDLTHGTISQFAGTPLQQPLFALAAWNGDGGPALQAGLAGLTAVAADHQGSLYILTSTAIRKVNIASGLIASLPLTGALATAFVQYHGASGMAVDPTGSTLYISVNNTIYAMTICSGAIAGQTTLTSYAREMTVDSQGNLFAAAGGGYARIPGGNGTPTYVAAPGNSVYGIAAGSNNNLYFGSFNAAETAMFIWKASTLGGTPTVYGSDGSWNFNGDGPGSHVTLGAPSRGLTADPSGIVYFSDTANGRVRKIVLGTGVVTTVAGSSVAGFSGDTGQATLAQFRGPTCLALDATAQKLYITDPQNQRIRVVDLQSGIINTLLSTANTAAFRTDNPALGFNPNCIALDGVGNLYIFEIDRLDKYTINTAAETSLKRPISPGPLTADNAGNVYYYEDCQVLQFSNGQVTPVAGTAGVCGDMGDNGPAADAELNPPTGIAYDGHGNLLITGNQRVRRIQLSTQMIYPVTADAPQTYYSGEGGPLACAQVNPYAVAADGAGNIFIGDESGRILEGVNWLATPSLTSPVTIAAYPGADGLGFAIDGSNFSATQNQSWTNGANHSLAANATQTGQDGYSYSFAGWSDGNGSASRSASASCPVTFTAMYNPPACGFYLSAPSATLDDSAQITRVFLNTTGGKECSWVAQSNNADWLHLTTASAGSGSGYFSLQIDANDAFAARTGTVSIANQTFSVTQLNPSDCSYQIETLAPGGLFGPAAATGSMWVNTVGPGCGQGSFATWQSVPQVSWLHVTAQSSTNYNGLVTYSVDANSSSVSRMGTILIGAPGGTVPFAVMQEGMGTTLAVSPSSAPAPSGGGSGWTEVYELGTTCDAWTAVSNQPWITVTSGASGSGSAMVEYSVDVNPGAARNGTLTIAGQTYTVNQAAGGANACTFSLALPAASAPIGGGPGGFGLTASSSLCFWSAISSAPWLSVTSGTTGAGSIAGGYSAAANNTSGARSATITIGGQIFTVNQAGNNTAITIQTSPSGLQFSVDNGAAQTAPQTVNLSTGLHTLSVVPTQTGGPRRGRSMHSPRGATAELLRRTRLQ